jgi:hypothetical protein
MKKAYLFSLILIFLILCVSNPGYAWQGRMAGMGDPYGLVQDESDFLIHPANIADGKGINYYGNYRFNWDSVPDWNHTRKQVNLLTGNTQKNPMSASGDETSHDALVGAAYPLGPGRMGIFLQYWSKNGHYGGHEASTAGLYRFGLKSEGGDVALRLLYGVPVDSFKLGGEFKLAYRQDENRTSIASNGNLINNITFGRPFDQTNILPYLFPFNSNYWEASFKGSLEGSVGPATFSFTAHGGFIFSGNNENHYVNIIMPASILQDKDYRGNVTGYAAGADVWFRVPLSKDLAAPLLIRVDYTEKTRDGFAIGAPWGAISNDPTYYRHKESLLTIEAGGGIDKSLGKGARVAAGLYYNFLRNRTIWGYEFPVTGYFAEYSGYPIAEEHRVLLKLSGEKEISSGVTMRMGLNAYYGWLSEDFNYREGSPNLVKLPLDGNHYGFTAWLGGTVKLDRFSVEPFIGGGYQKFSVSGNTLWPTNTSALEMELSKKMWSLGGGFSIKFN